MVVLLNFDGNEAGVKRLFREDGLGVAMPIQKPHITKNPTSPQQGARIDNDGGCKDSNMINFSTILGCYPIISQLAHYLDLNTLHSLSRTCRQFRFNLLQARKQLIAQSLRCSNDKAIKSLPSPTQEIHEPYERFGHPRRTSHFGKPGTCARDMVKDCRRCGRIVCRNCCYRGPNTVMVSTRLPRRHRRLCNTCLTAPLSALISPSPTILDSTTPAFTAHAFARDPCTCLDAVYLCRECGHRILDADTTYKRVWTWRSRYSTYLGSICSGSGVGEGHEGIKCARKEHCLGAEDKELEIDCSVAGPYSDVVASSSPSASSSDYILSTRGELKAGFSKADDKPGYLRQEVEGIGGVVKKKVKKRVRLGKTVRRYEDEAEKDECVGREMRGESRSWCGWCERVIPGGEDLNA